MQMNQRFNLSKSRFMVGLQCSKRLWLETHRRDLARVSATTAHVFRLGHLLGGKARDILGLGELIGHETNIAQALAETPSALARSAASGTFVYEAAFSYHHVVSRADGFLKLADGWRMVEVKASTSVKDYHLQDCAIQTWVAEGAGYPVREVYLAHLNKEFVYQGDGDYSALLTLADVTLDIQPYKANVESRVHAFRAMLAGPEPDIRTGDHCNEPFECSFIDYCSTQEPPAPEYPVSIFHGHTARRLRAAGYEDALTVPASSINSKSQQIIWHATRSNEVFYNSDVRRAMASLAYPRYFLDFETISSPVPLWAGTKPYQQVPFQWSCHTESAERAFTHQEFIDCSGSSPIEGFAQSLLATLGNAGPILVYSPFEASRIRDLAQWLPAYGPQLMALLPRLVDLLPVVRDSYYHPAMKGSYSIKSVVPTICPELDYGALDGVADGGAAQRAWWDMTQAACKTERVHELRAQLLHYCNVDTLAMVAVLRFLESGRSVTLAEFGRIDTTRSYIY
ncbi:DUF2779 domain-containing protein [Burkholderia multivorans]